MTKWCNTKRPNQEKTKRRIDKRAKRPKDRMTKSPNTKLMAKIPKRPSCLTNKGRVQKPKKIKQVSDQRPNK